MPVTLPSSSSGSGSCSVSGIAKGIDGTTLDVAGKTLRLLGIREAGPEVLKVSGVEAAPV